MVYYGSFLFRLAQSTFSLERSNLGSALEPLQGLSIDN